MQSKVIWFNQNLTSPGQIDLFPGTLSDFLNMEWVEIGADYLKLKMPVTSKVHQPYGILHGGASGALAETVGSVGSHLVIDSSQFICVGLEINANHIRMVKDGWITAHAYPLHLGSSTHIWDIKITDEQDRLVCVSRLTVAILPKK